jgi:hypothetical protein
MMKFHNDDGTFKSDAFPKTKTERYTFACEELDIMLEEGKLTRSEYYAECRILEREFYGDDYVD